MKNEVNIYVKLEVLKKRIESRTCKSIFKKAFLKYRKVSTWRLKGVTTCQEKQRTDKN